MWSSTWVCVSFFCVKKRCPLGARHQHAHLSRVPRKMNLRAVPPQDARVVCMRFGGASEIVWDRRAKTWRSASRVRPFCSRSVTPYRMQVVRRGLRESEFVKLKFSKSGRSLETEKPEPSSVACTPAKGVTFHDAQRTGEVSRFWKKVGKRTYRVYKHF